MFHTFHQPYYVVVLILQTIKGERLFAIKKPAHTKYFLRRHVNDGNGVCASCDFKNAIMASNMKNVSVRVALPPSKHTSKKQPAVYKLPKITLLSNFYFNQDEKFRVLRQYNIGEARGETVNKNQTKCSDEKFDKEEKTGQKCDPEEVSQEMRRIKDIYGKRRFKDEEFFHPFRSPVN